MEEERKVDAAAFGFPGPVRPGVTRVGWIGIGVMGGAMAKHLLAAGFAVTVYARTPAASRTRRRPWLLHPMRCSLWSETPATSARWFWTPPPAPSPASTLAACWWTA